MSYDQQQAEVVRFLSVIATGSMLAVFAIVASLWLVTAEESLTRRKVVAALLLGVLMFVGPDRAPTPRCAMFGGDPP